MNFEITEKNGNLSPMIDYFPNTGIPDFKRIEMKSNLGGEDEESQFDFNEKGYVSKLIYQVNDKLYWYEFFYEGNNLTNVNIAGKKRIPSLMIKRVGYKPLQDLETGQPWSIILYTSKEKTKQILRS